MTSIKLRDPLSRPLANYSIDVQLRSTADFRSIPLATRSFVTDNKGEARIVLPAPLPAEIYELVVSKPGSIHWSSIGLHVERHANETGADGDQIHSSPVHP